MGLNIFVQYGMLRYFYLVVLLVKVFYNGYKNSLNGLMHIISILYIPIGMYCIIIYMDRIGIFRTPYIRTYVCVLAISVMFTITFSQRSSTYIYIATSCCTLYVHM